MSDANAQTQAEPSMEEILASIRRIISEDEPAEGEAPEAAAAPEPESKPKAEPDSASGEVLELTQKVNEDGSITDLAEEAKEDIDSVADTLAEAFPDAPPDEPEPEADNVADTLADAFPDAPPDEPEADDVADTLAEAFPDEPPAEPEPDDAAETADIDASGEGLVTPPVEVAAAGSFTELARAVSAAQVGAAVQIGDGRTLEQIVREALTPELRAWLDTNLAALVEQIVREEIKRLVRRAEDQ